MTLKNVLLGVSVGSFLVGFSNLQENIFFWMGKPVGAIFFILYFILFVLEKEYHLFDQQNETAASAPKAAGKSPKPTTAPALTTAIQ